MQSNDTIDIIEHLCYYYLASLDLVGLSCTVRLPPAFENCLRLPLLSPFLRLRVVALVKRLTFSEHDILHVLNGLLQRLIEPRIEPRVQLIFFSSRYLHIENILQFLSPMYDKKPSNSFLKSLPMIYHSPFSYFFSQGRIFELYLNEARDTITMRIVRHAVNIGLFGSPASG